jgi:hypothetical protein
VKSQRRVGWLWRLAKCVIRADLGAFLLIAGREMIADDQRGDELVK